ncbi:MAG TPA: ABC transporter permease [Gammaproteobacteria bacterium]|nr:ABC transporter permease [Gammaproteobacteria bacterium]
MLLASPARLIEKIGFESIYITTTIGSMVIFLLQCVGNIFTPPIRFKAVLRQIYFIGARSLLVISVTGLFTGMVLALLAYYNLKQYGNMELIGAATALGLIQELGPVLAALMVIGRAGSAMTAELGIMRNSEQIDALECMGIDPYRFLITPKFIAMIFSLPLLTMVFDVVGIAGGYFVAVISNDVASGSFIQGMVANVGWDDLRLGMVKPLSFSLIIVWICSYNGYFVHQNRSGVFGAEGVSLVTTNAVVMSSVSVLALDYIVGLIML